MKKVKAEDEVEVVVERDDEEMEFQVTLGYFYKKAPLPKDDSDDDK